MSVDINRFPMTGVELWKNPKNKFLVFQLHYSADIKKRDPVYRETVKSSMPIKQYNQEYELSWETFEGKPVYEDFQRAIHGSKENLVPEIGLPLLRGWDFGLTPACIVGQYVEGQLRIIHEFVEVNMGAERFSDLVLKECAVRWPNWCDKKKHWRDFGDPSGAFRKDTDEGTCFNILSGKGLAPIPGPVAWEKRRSAVEKFLTHRTKQGPSFLIDLAGCPILVKGFEGGYRYPEKSFDVEPNKVRPIKDEFSHPHDGLQYICAKLDPRDSIRSVSVPAPSYAGSKSYEFNPFKHGHKAV